ncbi:AraC family transcriptional regulator [Pedobacter sp. MC2016-24]|uniref:helix-turn-helix domain-containing protein n=1 Tax=Pedobacter sp. MC2016-24 TaxID=2780090 RepID=UPI001D16AFC8|nr:AraC family transcriptional regulator [Pedobacter sp. MC2016-24]
MNLIKSYFNLLNTDYVKLGLKWNFSNVISPYYRLYYIDEGEGLISSLEGNLVLKPGHLYLIPSFTLCNLSCSHFLSQYFIQFFEESPDGLSLFTQCRKVMCLTAAAIDITNFKRILTLNPGRGINRSDDPKVYEKDIYYKEYTELNASQSLAVQYETQGIILQLISRFLKPDVFRADNPSVIPSVILDAISYIQINISSVLKVRHLADRAHLNTDYFSRLFHRFTGKSPVNYIVEKRIERAQYLIIATNNQYGDIAQLTGFENSQYFSRIFKRKTGLTPGQYRMQNKTMTSRHVAIVI